MDASLTRCFQQNKSNLACDMLLTYLDFNETFKTHTNARAFQLGAFIIQEGKSIVFYSIKCTGDQQQYTVAERELISIVETLKEFRAMLICQRLIMCTNRKNLTCNNFNTNIVLRWRLILEEYGLDI